MRERERARERERGRNREKRKHERLREREIKREEETKTERERERERERKERQNARAHARAPERKTHKVCFVYERGREKAGERAFEQDREATRCSDLFCKKGVVGAQLFHLALLH